MNRRRALEHRWVVTKSYYQEPEGGDMLTAEYPILYGSEPEASDVMEQLRGGSDKSWFDADGNEYAGYSAILFVQRIQL